MTAKRVDKLVKLSVFTALSVLGRVCFAFLPFFKPVSAMVVMAGFALGPWYGFACGAMSALISNFAFGQGMWTPFQMMAWGLIGLMAGLAAPALRKGKWTVIPCGIISGAAFSLVMDLFSTLWMDGGFNLSRYAVLIATAAPVTFVYIVSDIIFLWLMWTKGCKMYDERQ